MTLKYTRKKCFLTDVEFEPFPERTRIKTNTRGNRWISYNTAETRASVVMATVVVLSNDPKNDVTRDLPKSNKNIIVLPLNAAHHSVDSTNNSHSSNSSHRDNINNFMREQVQDLTKNVWVMIHQSSGSQEFYESLSDLIQIRNDAEQSHSLPKGSFPLYCLIVGANLRQQKRELNKQCKSVKNAQVVTLESTAASDIAGFLLEHARNNIAKVEQILRTPDTDATFVMDVTMRMDGDDEYYRRVYKNLIELFDDHSSQLRVQLHHLFDIPNVRIDRTKSSEDDFLVVVELRPLKVDKLESFIVACRNGQIPSLIQDRLILNRARFRGAVVVEIKGASNVKSFLLKERERNDTGNPHEARNKEMTLKKKILFKIYDECLVDNTRTPYDFLKMLAKHGVKHLLSELQNDGYNAMHLAILHQREDFLEMLLYQNEWGFLRHQPVSSANTSAKHAGLTPRRLAESMAYKSRGHETLRAYDHFESIWNTMTPLSKAAISGRLDLVRIVCIGQPEMLRHTDFNGADSLMYACGAGHRDIVHHLLQNGSGTKTQDEQKESCVHVAAKYGQTSVLEELLKVTFDILGQKNSDGYTAADICAKNGDLATLELYQKHRLPLSGRCLGIAIKYKQHSVVRMLVNDCKVDVNSGADKDGRLPIHHAVMKGDIASLNVLMEHKVDLTKKDKCHKTVLHLAVEGEHMEMLRELTQRLKDSGELADLMDSRDGFTGRNLLYMVRGKDHGRRAWHWVQLVRIYIHAFTVALKSGQIDVAQHGVVKYSGFGSSPDARTNAKIEQDQDEALKPDNLTLDMTALHHAANKGNSEIAEHLLRLGANANARDRFDNTPVHIAAMRGSLPVIVLFSRYGADMWCCTQDKTPMDIADANGHIEVQNYLQGRKDIDSAKRFLQEVVADVSQQLSENELRSRQVLGQDIRRHLINTVRELSISVNEALIDFGSGPVTEACLDSGPSEMV